MQAERGTAMTEELADRIMETITHAAGMYYRLVMVVSPAGGGKTVALQDVHNQTGAPLVNVNLVLSRELLELTGRQRAIQLPRILSGILDKCDTDLVLFDNIEVLFDVSLKQDPLRLLQSLSRNRTIVAAWSGTVDEDHVVYGMPDHAEYRRYPLRDFLVVDSESP
jgi:hypothetical protein